MTRQIDYPLRALLGLRQRIREVRTQELATAQTAEREAEGALADAERELADRRARRDAEGRRVAAEASDVATLLRQQRYLDRLASEIRAQLEVVADRRRRLSECEAAREDARVALAGAEQEAKAVERHHERWDHRRREEELARAEEELEGLVAARHGSRRL
ncbi:MAG: hypothetical protein IT371_25045 [Deltaproteobacteria bacterium]|nr:hypothetical protein [Deltaproteobacteria bacterium]